MREEVKRILKMVQEGKLTAEQAAELIEAFESGEAADTASTSTGEPRMETPPPPPPGATSGDPLKDPFKSFVETIERIGKEATDSVNWQEVGKQVRDGARKGVESLRIGIDQVTKGKVTFPWLGNQETREVTLPLTIPSGKTLRVDNACGEVKVVGGFDVGSVSARARFRGASPEDAKAKAENYTLIIEESEHMVLIRQPDVSGLQVDVEVQMPGTGAVEVRTSSGNVALLDTGGSARVDGVSGNIQARRLNGVVEISATSGNIDVEDVQSPSVAIENKAGNILLRRIRGNVNARTAGGNVALEECAGKTLSVESVAGEVALDLSEPVSGTVNVRTVSGNARLTLADGGDCRVSLSTLRGAVHCDLELKDEATSAQRVTGRLGEGTGTLDVSAVTGNITISMREHRPH